MLSGGFIEAIRECQQTAHDKIRIPRCYPGDTLRQQHHSGLGRAFCHGYPPVLSGGFIEAPEWLVGPADLRGMYPPVLSGGFIEAYIQVSPAATLGIRYPPVLSGGFIEARSPQSPPPRVSWVSPGVIRGLH